MTTTEALRAAATKLREMAESATPGPWAVSADRLETHLDLRLVACADDKGDITDWLQSGDAHLIATLDPTFAGLVADWLDAAVWFLERSHSASNWSRAVTERRLRHQMLIARHVIGEEAPQIAPTHGQERPKPANVGTGEGAPDLGALIGAREVYARGGPLGGPTTVAVSHVGYCARGHDLYAIDGVTQHIITHAETKSGNWAKATCPNVIVERSEDME